MGLVINEISFVAFLILLASSLPAFLQYGIDSLISKLFFAMAALTAIGLGVIVYQSLEAIAVLKNALRDLPTKGGQKKGKAPTVPRFHLVALLGPFFLRRPGVKKISNIAYGDAGKRNRLDLYKSTKQKTIAPVFIHFHGGGMYRGKKSTQALPLIYRLASKGWICISANYRLRPAACYPDHQVDVKKVIAWVRCHADEFNLDTSTIIVAGGSAGGQLACQAALTINDPLFQPGFPQVDTSIAACISFYGYYGWLGSDLIEHTNHYNTSIPPMFIVHGDRDELCLVGITRDFVTKMRSISSQPVLYAQMPGAQHVFDLFHSIRSEAVIDSVEAFLETIVHDNVAKTESHPCTLPGDPPA